MGTRQWFGFATGGLPLWEPFKLAQGLGGKGLDRGKPGLLQRHHSGSKFSRYEEVAVGVSGRWTGYTAADWLGAVRLACRLIPAG